MSTGAKRLNTSSVDSGSSQNCEGSDYDLESARRCTYASPVGVIGWDLSLFGEFEDALLEDKL